MNTCRINAEVRVADKVIKTKCWPECDVMKTRATRAWATRQFNRVLKDLNECDKPVAVYWEAHYGEAAGFHLSKGRLGGINGRVLSRTGIFDPLEA